MKENKRTERRRINQNQIKNEKRKTSKKTKRRRDPMEAEAAKEQDL